MPKKSEAKKNLISRFLDQEQVDIKTLKKVDEILELPSETFNFLNSEDAKLINEVFEVKDIGDFSLLDEQDPFKDKEKAERQKIKDYLEKNPEFEEKVKKAITISLITRRIKDKSLPSSKTKQKIAVVGLDNAGKTAILSKFGGKMGLKDLALLKPTKVIDRQEILTEELELNIWDFGGQADYRNQYLRQPEKYFLGINLLLYVVDIQDTDKYDESLEYFEKIIEIVLRLELNPSILIFLHKYDPDLRGDDDVLLNIELLKDLFNSIFKNEKLDHEIFLTSIYSMVANEPKFAQFMKNIMKDTATLADPDESRMNTMGDILENTLSMVIQLSENTIKQLEAIENRVAALEGGISVGAGAGAIPPPPTSLNPPPKAPQGGLGTRAAIVSELKDFFARKNALNKY